MRADIRDIDDDQLLRALDSLRDVFAIFDDRNQLIYWNDHAERRSGYSAAELAGMQPQQLVADEDLPKLKRYLQQVDEDGLSTVEVRLVSKDGETVPHELYSDRLTDDTDAVIGRVVVGRDVSERWTYERVLEHKNARLEEFARFVSHDVRSPLAVAAGWLERYRETGDDDHYRKVVEAHERIDQIIDDLLGLTSTDRASDSFESADVGDVARTAWQTVRAETATLTVEETATVVADRGLLTQAFENLFRNCVEHGSTGPRLQARESGAADETDPDPEADAVTVEIGLLDDGFYVADDGPGVPERTVDRLFEPGVTTRPDGTGLGLAIVDEIAGLHGWSVDIRNDERGGARVEFTGVRHRRS
jgi:PAS domain S-box-containing protein